MGFKITIDCRENHTTSDEHNMTPRFDERGIKYSMEQLNVGDYLIENETNGLKFCVERKIFSDLVGSIYNGRLFNELFKMNESYSKNFLIIVGSHENFYKERAGLKARGFVKKVNTFSRNQLLGIMATVAARYMNIEMIFVKDDNEFIDFLLLVAEKLTDGRDIKGMTLTHSKSKENTYRNVLMSLPGISEEKAKRIEAIYPGFSELRAALRSNSFKIDGIGAKTTESFLNVFVL